MRPWQRTAVAALGAIAAVLALYAVWLGWQSPSLMLRLMQLPTLCS